MVKYYIEMKYLFPCLQTSISLSFKKLIICKNTHERLGGIENTSEYAVKVLLKNSSG